MLDSRPTHFTDMQEPIGTSQIDERSIVLNRLDGTGVLLSDFNLLRKVSLD